MTSSGDSKGEPGWAIAPPGYLLGPRFGLPVFS